MNKTRRSYAWDIVEFGPNTKEGFHTFKVLHREYTMIKAEMYVDEIMEGLPKDSTRAFGFIPVQRMRTVDTRSLRTRVSDRITNLLNRIPRPRIEFSLDRRVPRA